jgi:integrase
MEAWFDGLTESMIRARLQGWLLWQQFCEQKSLVVADLQKHAHPAILVADFVFFMQAAKTPPYKRRNALPAVTLLFSLTHPLHHLSTNEYLRSAVRGTVSTIKQQSRYRDIWDLSILLDYIRNGPPAEELSWEELMARTVALMMIFIPLRPAAMLRLNPSKERRSEANASIEVLSHDKTDSKSAATWVVIRPLEDKKLCPLTQYELQKSGAQARGCTDTIWCSEKGTPHKRTDKMLKLVCELLRRAGISKQFKGYSIRHATISALYKFKMNEHEVSAYTGHSHNSHTTLNYYYHLDKAWVGSSLATLTQQGLDRTNLERILQDEEAEDEEE